MSPPTRIRPGQARSQKGMVLAIEPGIYWPGGGGLRLEDNFLITDDGNEKLCTYPGRFSAGRTQLRTDELWPNQIKAPTSRLNPKLVERILAEVKEEEIVAMCCDVINIPSPTGDEGEMAEYMRAACGSHAARRHLAGGRGRARQRDRPLGRHWHRQEPDVQRPHGHVEHRPRRIPHRHRLQAARRRSKTE